MPKDISYPKEYQELIPGISSGRLYVIIYDRAINKEIILSTQISLFSFHRIIQVSFSNIIFFSYRCSLKLFYKQIIYVNHKI